MIIEAQQYSAARAALLAGCSYRQCDYWCRLGVLPGHVGMGSGGRREFSSRDVAMLRLCTLLSWLNAPTATMAEAVRLVEDLALLEGLLVIEPFHRSGRGINSGAARVYLLAGELPAVAMVVDLAACRI